ncbi:MAG TPA: DUF4328 domain-containing protein [Acidimicrobiales bacterium]|nr:DUF4328 domain-containing protein [Acidimicrobiales bacterium]
MSYYQPGPPGPYQQPPMVAAAPYTAPPTPADGLGIAVAILLGIMALLALVVAGTQFNEYTVVDDIITTSGDSSIGDLIDADDARAGALGFFYLAYAATGIVFVIWQYRHSRNAEALAGPGGLGPAWAIAGWFIPLAALVLPGIEIYQSSQASSPPAPGGGPRSGKGNGLVIAWIVAFALGGLALSGNFWLGTMDDGFSSTDPDNVRTLLLLGSVGGLLLTVAAILGAIMVQSLTKNQTRRIREVFGGGMFVPWGAQPPPAWGPAQPAAPWGPAPAPPPQAQPPWGAPPGAPPPPPGGPAPWHPPTQ